MKPRELSVSFYDLKVKATLKGSDAPPIAPSVAQLLELCKRADREPMQNGPVRKVLEDWQATETGQHSILVNRADRDKTDVALVNFENGNRRTAGKTPDDGIEFSCHILIVPAVAPRLFPLLLATGGSGMSLGQIESVLNTLLRRVEADPINADFFTRPHPSAELGKMTKLHCKFELLAHPSLMLTEILAHGTLSEVQLIAHEVRNIDQDFVQKSHSVTMGLARAGESVGLAAFRRAIGLLDIQPDQLVLKFKDPETGKDAARTISINDLESAMTKRDTITFDTDLMPSYQSVSTAIIDKMQALV